MIIDSGASIVALPHEMALACGLEPGSEAPNIRLILADGRPIEAKGITIDSLRVGKFTVENVECGVLGPEAVAAKPLLGMSFLREFKFELNTQRRTLTMVKVDEGGGSRKQF
jgi:aspartyl protease family protein